MGTILVTGAAGFVGSHTTDALLAAGHQVVGIDNFRTGHRENLEGSLQNEKFRLVELDVAAEGALAWAAAETKPDAIIHLAALVSVPQSIANPALNFRLNVEGTQRVIEAARYGRVRRVVFASSAAVYGDNPDTPLSERSETRPISPYGAAKLASEALLLGGGATFGFSVCCLRYFNIFGPRQDPKSPYSGVISIFCDRFRAGAAPTIHGDGEQTRDFVYVRDVARANLLAATKPGVTSSVLNICTGKPTSLSRLASVLRNQFPGSPAPLHGTPREGDIRHSLGSGERARAVLGFEAEVGLEDGLRELASARGPASFRA